MKPFSSSKAQVSIETTALIVLAIIALLVMSSYVTRGINAYFKTSEETVKDSFQEIILQSERIVEDCSQCVEEVGECGINGCAGDEQWITYVCPPGCETPPGRCGDPNPEECCEWERIGCNVDPCGNGEMTYEVSCPGMEPYP